MTESAVMVHKTLGEKKGRESGIDCMRGLVMILMALDHVRSFWFVSHVLPNDVTQVSGSLFFTRWITHFCAPVFVFLAGVGVRLAVDRGKSKLEMSRYLVIRGFILILLDIMYMSPLWGGPAGFYILQVLWAIGWSMIILAGLIWLPEWIIAVTGAVSVVGHNLLDGMGGQWSGISGAVWSVLHVPQVISLWGNTKVLVLYPLIPWIGVMAIGYIAGALWQQDKKTRAQKLIWGGVSLSTIFVTLRGMNGYGDPLPWQHFSNQADMLMSFLNCEKYPPSLSYLFMTLGPGLVALGALEKVGDIRSTMPVWGEWMAEFGKVPFFYYLVHVPMIYLLIGLNGAFILHQPFWETIKKPPTYDALAVIYCVWGITVMLLYPLCRWYGTLKRDKRWTWLRYM